jgi:hypothetical protein
VHDDGSSVRNHDADLEEVAGMVGPNQHDEAIIEVFDAHRVVKRVKDCLIADTVLAGARRDRGLIH